MKTFHLVKSCFYVLAYLSITNFAYAGVIFNSNGLSGGSRWDADQRTIFGAGDRSLVDGLSYSMEGGSYQAFRDMFSWDVLPSVAAFTYTVDSAFNVWSSIDPESGLGTNLSFSPDLSTAVVGVEGGGIDRRGAEIDLFAADNAFYWNPGNNGRQGETWLSVFPSPVTLTSGTQDYSGSSAIVGADIILNNNAGAVYSLDLFFRLLTHEIGHALGLGDVDIFSNRFIDDNFDGSAASLNNSWAQKVNVYDPASSPLQVYNIGSASQLSGVDILMESRGLGISAGNPVYNPLPLTNDDYGMRQFLYPFINIPEPTSIILLLTGLFALILPKPSKL
ncbi:hypothetical protein [Thalassotalea ganghwensis]